MSVVYKGKQFGLADAGAISAYWHPDLTVTGWEQLSAPPYVYHDGDEVHTIGMPYQEFDGTETIVLFHLMEHSVDGVFRSVFANRRNDRLIPFDLWACGQEYCPPPYKLDGFVGHGGDQTGPRVEVKLRAPSGEYRIAPRYSGFGIGTNHDDFVVEPMDPIHMMGDAWLAYALSFTGVRRLGAIARSPNERLLFRGNDSPHLVLPTPDPGDMVLDILSAKSEPGSTAHFEMLPTYEPQHVLHASDVGSGDSGGNYEPGFSEVGSGYFSGTPSAMYKTYCSIRPRSGPETPTGWEMVVGDTDTCYAHVAMVLKS